MFGSATVAWDGIASTIVQHPILATTVALSIQLLSITLGATLLVRFTRHAPAWSHRIWLCAIALAIVAVPLHYSAFGWRIGVPSAPVKRPTASPPATAPPPIAMPAVPIEEVEHSPVTPIAVPASTFGDSQRAVASARAEEKSTPENTGASQFSVGSHPDAAADWQQAWVLRASLLLYAFVLTMLLLRLVWGMRRLHWISNAATELPPDTMSIFDRCATTLHLSRQPRVLASDRVSVPLTFGCLRATVLVPRDFSSWSVQEQRAVALHELAHIKRRDVDAELVSRLMVAIYWFHPASLFLQRMLRVSRELATDELVLNAGEARHMYAESIVSILSRVHAAERPILVDGPSVAMSRLGDVEHRLRNVLAHARRPLPAGLGGTLIGMLLVVAAASTFQLNMLDAQSSPTSNPIPPVVPDGSAVAARQPTENASSADGWDAITTSDNDMLSRIRDCDVLTVTGEEYHAILSVEGQVLSADGQPVEDAIVLLRESSTARISSEPKKYIDIEDRHLTRVNDVFARTRTDRQGKYRFENVKSPALPKHWSNSWSGSVVAGHPTKGIGWQTLVPKQDRQRFDLAMTIRLSPTRDISGTYSTPSADPIEDAVVLLQRIESARPIAFADSYNLDLQASQLTPTSTTNAEGVCAFKGLPQGFAAIVYSPPQLEWMGTAAVVATSEDLPLGDRGPQVRMSITQTLVGSPFQLVADPGISVVGKVQDEAGLPVSGASVSLQSSMFKSTSDEEGRFHLQLPTRTLEFPAFQQENSIRFFVRTPAKDELLARSVKVSADEIRSNTPIKVVLERGIAVRGTIVDDDGLPVAGISVRQMGDPLASPAYATSDARGEYELYLSRGRHVLLFSTDEPGFQLPSQRTAMIAKDPEKAQLPHLVADVSAGNSLQLGPFQVARSREIEVIVSLPDGKPAVDANVVLKDEEQLSTGRPNLGSLPVPTVKREISERASTNTQGRARLLPKGTPSSSATAEVTLTRGQASYYGRAQLVDAENNVLSVVLEDGAMLEGSVLLDGQPAPGAVVSVGESTRFTREGPNGISIMGASISNHRTALTDREGHYRIPVENGKEYSVSVQSMPGSSESPGTAHLPQKVSDGLFRVRPFAFITGKEEIAGVVVDAEGAPVQGAHVSVANTIDSDPAFWIGHRSSSQFTTDDSGKFHLKCIPRGRYKLRVSLPRDGSRKALPATAEAQTGNMDLRITVETRPLPQVPRLEPKTISGNPTP
ncbi:MAG: carboxypeptidase regulatory-like domain-containing protein [Aureliella sp.]